MCRLYGLRASHPRPVSCELLDAQNALVRQSRRDARGLSNPDGWGIGFHREGESRCLRQVGPAFDSREFRERATGVRATTILAHVRRATVGGRALENTHPFRVGDSMLVHNGHVGAFDGLRTWLLDEMEPARLDAIRGTTDSEHLFALLLSRADREPGRDRAAVLAGAILDLRRRVEEVAGPEAELALNLLWTTADELVGSRVGRTLHYVERTRPYLCERHGRVHDPPPAEEPYRAVAVASEPITAEEWTPLPEGSVFRVARDLELCIEPVATAARRRDARR